MSQKLINHSPDLKKLQDDGYEIEVKGGLLLVRHIPYVNSNKEIKFGVLVSELTQSADKTSKPSTHVIMFQGQQPCNKDGSVITGIVHSNQKNSVLENFTVDFTFSNRPSTGYNDYYHKISTYANIISAPAKSINDNVTEKTFFVPKEENDDSVFNYADTNSSRANVNNLSSKLKGQKIAIIGLGGTGSYILDFLAKTPVLEIHLFDSDEFLLHNAFRSPGAASVDQLNTLQKKVFYYHEIYSHMRKNIIPHDYALVEEKLNELNNMSYVFLSIDKGRIKKKIFEHLIKYKIPFIDVGMGIHKIDDKFLIGTVRVTTGTTLKSDHLSNRISMADDEEDDYNSNIQIAELNALNASLAVIKWKKLSGFYNDSIGEHHSLYSISDSLLLNEDYTT